MTATPDTVQVPTIVAMRQLGRMVMGTVQRNVDGVSHEESLVQPQPAGNCSNWVLGHLLAIYHKALPMLGQQPVMAPETLARYDRGSPPLTNAADALPFPVLLSAWNETCARVDAGLAAVPQDALGHPVPNSPSGNPNETVGSMLFTVLFHQAYHSGQLGLLRRIAGREGAIK